jgi:hypothetical protein
MPETTQDLNIALVYKTFLNTNDLKLGLNQIEVMTKYVGQDFNWYLDAAQHLYQKESNIAKLYQLLTTARKNKIIK